jgi:hypothetical protein
MLYIDTFKRKANSKARMSERVILNIPTPVHGISKYKDLLLHVRWLQSTYSHQTRIERVPHKEFQIFRKSQLASVHGRVAFKRDGTSRTAFRVPQKYRLLEETKKRSNRSDWEFVCFNIFVAVYENSGNRKNMGNKYIRDITAQVVDRCWKRDCFHVDSTLP